MPANASPDTSTETQPAVAVAQPCQLSVHIAFNQLPIATYPGDSPGDLPVKYAPPFIRFPVNLTAEDAVVLENILSSAAIALVGFQIEKGDGGPGYYRAIVARD